MIPSFDHNLVLPPHLGNPTNPSELSPYPCSSLELCTKFATSPERIDILFGFLKFRSILRSNGLINGVQWLDGSFLEDVEARSGRAPRDLDLVTIYWGYDDNFQSNLINKVPEFNSSVLSKKTFKLDHYPFDASYSPIVTVNFSRYWSHLFSHRRDGIWKGMLSIELNTSFDDKQAFTHLQTVVL